MEHPPSNPGQAPSNFWIFNYIKYIYEIANLTQKELKTEIDIKFFEMGLETFNWQRNYC